MYIMRVISHAYDFQKITPVIHKLLYSLPQGNVSKDEKSSGVIKDNFYDRATDILNYYDIRYITINKNFIKDKKIIDATKEFIEKWIQIDNVYEDKFLIAYKVKKIVPSSYYVALNTEQNSWGQDGVEKSSGMAYRPASSGAQIIAVNMDSQAKTMRLTMDAKSKKARTLLVEKEGNTVVTLTTGDNWQKTSGSFMLTPGENQFIIKVLDENGKELSTQSLKKEGIWISQIILESQ